MSGEVGAEAGGKAGGNDGGVWSRFVLKGMHILEDHMDQGMAQVLQKPSHQVLKETKKQS